MKTNPLQEAYQTLNRLSGERLEILRDAILSFTATRAPQGAASLAYYAIFSLFPLLLLFIITGSFFIDSRSAYLNVVRSVEGLIPVSPQLIEENLQFVLEQRGPVGVLVLISLAWSASGVFTNLAYNINLAWVDAPPRNLLDRYLVGLGMVLILGALLILSVLADWLVHIVPFLDRLGSSDSLEGFWYELSRLGSWLLIFLMFLALYRWIPTLHISWSAAFWAALTASAGWKLATTGFAWYLGSGLDRYRVVYGSLGAIIAWLFLIYLISLSILFGAHLAAAVDGRVKRRRAKLLEMKGEGEEGGPT